MVKVFTEVLLSLAYRTFQKISPEAKYTEMKNYRLEVNKKTNR